MKFTEGFRSWSQGSPAQRGGCSAYLLSSETRSRGWRRRRPRPSRRWWLSWGLHRRPRRSPRSSVRPGSDPGARSCLWPLDRRCSEILQRNTDFGVMTYRIYGRSLAATWKDITWDTLFLVCFFSVYIEATELYLFRAERVIWYKQ